MAPLADYLTVNISSPNTPGLRALQDKGALEALLDGVAAAQPAGAAKPVFLKVAPDLEPADIDDIVAVAFDKGLAAVIVSNRSEEHTSELQSLMRISYAVFCLKKKQIQHNPNHQHHIRQ